MTPAFIHMGVLKGSSVFIHMGVLKGSRVFIHMGVLRGSRVFRMCVGYYVSVAMLAQSPVSQHSVARRPAPPPPQAAAWASLWS